MAIPARDIHRWASSAPQPYAKPPMQFHEPISDKLAWLRLRELTDIPANGLALFSGTRPEKNARYREFRNFVRQARTYWDAAAQTAGSAGALLHYYAILNLAKAELLQTNPSQVLGQNVAHGLSANMTAGDSIRTDALTPKRGVFSMLYEKRVGSPLPIDLKLPILNLLAQIPEISLEFQNFGAPRPPSVAGYHTFAMNETEAWSLVGLPMNIDVEAREPVTKLLMRAYDRIDLEGFDWRKYFAISTRSNTKGFVALQSKKTFSVVQEGISVPDVNSAMAVLWQAAGPHISEPLNQVAEFILSHSLRKSKAFALPLSLARYAATYYLSSVVRYRPAKLDPTRRGDQAWLMDSFVNELPVTLLADAVAGITGSIAYFEPAQFRI